MCPSLPKRGWKNRRKILDREASKASPYKSPSVRSAKYASKPKKKGFPTLIVLIMIVGLLGIFYVNDPAEFTSYVSELNEEMTQIFTDAPEKIDTFVEEIIEEVKEEYHEIVKPENVYGNYSFGLVKSPTGVLSNSYDDFIVLINNKNAVNPTYNQLVKFVKDDKTDEYTYQYTNSDPGSYYGTAESQINLTLIKGIVDGVEDMIIPRICGGFAQRLHNSAEMSGIRCGYVSIDLVGYTDPYDYGIPENSGHAFNVFNTTDKGIVYIDCTGGVGDGPSHYDKIISNFRVGVTYTSTSLFPESGWVDVWDTMGKVTDIYITWDGDWD